MSESNRFIKTFGLGDTIRIISKRKIFLLIFVTVFTLGASLIFSSSSQKHEASVSIIIDTNSRLDYLEKSYIQDRLLSKFQSYNSLSYDITGFDSIVSSFIDVISDKQNMADYLSVHSNELSSLNLSQINNLKVLKDDDAFVISLESDGENVNLLLDSYLNFSLSQFNEEYQSSIRSNIDYLLFILSSEINENRKLLNYKIDSEVRLLSFASGKFSDNHLANSKSESPTTYKNELISVNPSNDIIDSELNFLKTISDRDLLSNEILELKFNLNEIENIEQLSLLDLKVFELTKSELSGKVPLINKTSIFFRILISIIFSFCLGIVLLLLKDTSKVE